jgi:cytochrome c oxidase subunit 3
MTGAPRRLPSSIDVSSLPATASGVRAALWWGVMLLIAIEGTMMALLLVSYLYLRGNFQVWPPTGVGDRAFRLAVAQLALLAASFVPMVITARAARANRLGPARLALLLGTLIGGVLPMALRALEMAALPFRWDSNAHGSMFWMILGLHTTHVVAGIAENLVMVALLYRGPVEKKVFTDVECSALLWYFVVLEWIPAFALLYLEPILLAR